MANIRKTKRSRKVRSPNRRIREQRRVGARIYCCFRGFCERQPDGSLAPIPWEPVAKVDRDEAEMADLTEAMRNEPENWREHWQILRKRIASRQAGRNVVLTYYDDGDDDGCAPDNSVESWFRRMADGQWVKCRRSSDDEVRAFQLAHGEDPDARDKSVPLYLIAEAFGWSRQETDRWAEDNFLPTDAEITLATLEYKLERSISMSFITLRKLMGKLNLAHSLHTTLCEGEAAPEAARTTVRAGNVFGRGAVIGGPVTDHGHRYWTMRCDCDVLYVAREDHLLPSWDKRRGEYRMRTQSCGRHRSTR